MGTLYYLCKFSVILNLFQNEVFIEKNLLKITDPLFVN